MRHAEVKSRMKGMAFTAEAAQAIAEGCKTQTRRVIKPQPDSGKMRWNGERWEMYMGYPLGHDVPPCPHGTPGDRLFVQEPWIIEKSMSREEWLANGGNPWETCMFYASRVSPIPQSLDNNMVVTRKGSSVTTLNPTQWYPPKSMPRWASRSLLEITGVRVERLQDITERDARAEGVSDGGCLNCGNSEPCKCNNPQPDARDGFAYIWHQLYGDDPVKGWDANPWVWVIEFRRIP